MIVLTGATGFLGSNLLGKLLDSGYEVTAIIRTNSNISRIEGLVTNPRLTIHDVERKPLSSIFEKEEVEVIVHTATEYGRGTSNVSKILDANLILPIRLIELGIEFKTKCFINTDSYFNKGGSSYSNLLNYSLSKKSLLVWIKRLSEKIKVINITLEHMYGPGDSNSKFVEHLIQKIAVENSSRISLTHGHQRRDFIYVDDVAEAFIHLIEYGLKHDFTFKNFDVGTGISIPIREFAESVKSLSNSQSALGFGDIAYRSDEIMDSKADIADLIELGWRPKVAVRDGILRIIENYGVR